MNPLANTCLSLLTVADLKIETIDEIVMVCEAVLTCPCISDIMSDSVIVWVAVLMWACILVAESEWVMVCVAVLTKLFPPAPVLTTTTLDEWMIVCDAVLRNVTSLVIDEECVRD